VSQPIDKTPFKIFTELAGQNRGHDDAKPVMPARERFVLVVSDLKPDPRAGEVARCWLQI
jgi:hypothetical protein